MTTSASRGRGTPAVAGGPAGPADLHRRLLEIVQDIGDGSDLHAVMARVFRITDRLLPCDSFLLVIRQEDQYRVLFETDLDDQNRRIFPPVPRIMIYNRARALQQLLTRPHLLIHRTPAVVHRLQEQGDHSNTPLLPTGNMRRRSASLLFVPIRYGQEFVGMISAQAYQYNAYRTAHIDQLKTVAAYVSLGLQTLQASRHMLRSAGDALRRIGDILDDIDKYADAEGAAICRRLDAAEMEVSRMADALPNTSA